MPPSGHARLSGWSTPIRLREWDRWTEALAQQQPFREPGTTQGYHALTYGWLVGELIRRIDGRRSDSISARK